MNLVSFSVFFLFFSVIISLMFVLGKKNKKTSEIISNKDNEEVFLRYKWFSIFLPSITVIICILFFWIFIYFDSDDRITLLYQLIAITASLAVIFFYLKKEKVLSWK